MIQHTSTHIEWRGGCDGAFYPFVTQGVTVRFRTSIRGGVAITLCGAAAVLLSGCLGPPLAITAADLPGGITDTNYSVQLAADQDATNWELVDGALPDGLALSDKGVIAGAPRAAGSFEFKVRARAANNPLGTDEQAFTIVIVERLVLAADLPDGRKSEAYSYSPTIAGGTPPYSFVIIGLPAGMDYDRATGRVFGTPVLENSTLALSISAGDAGTPPQTATVESTWSIKPANVAIVTDSLPGGKVGSAYSATVERRDGQAPFVYSIIGGVLPDGLRLNRTSGAISGTPTTAETATFTVEVRDSGSPASVATRDYSIEVAP